MNNTSQPAITRGHARLFLTAAIVTYLLVTLGGVVCVTDSSQGCPDWPWCYGKLYPPLRQDSIIEYTHRAVAMLTGALILASAVVTLLRAPRMGWVSIPSALSILFLILVSIFGMLVVTVGLSRGWAAADLGSALITLGLMSVAAFAARRYNEYPGRRLRFRLHRPPARVALWTVIAMFILLVSGVLAAESGALERCLGLPLFSRSLLSDGLLGAVQIGRRVLAVIVVLLAAAAAVQAWRRRAEDPHTAQVARWLVGGLLVELATGLLLVTTGLSLVLQIIYVILATAAWVLAVLLLAKTALEVDAAN